jgi:hypothetical protein
MAEFSALLDLRAIAPPARLLISELVEPMSIPVIAEPGLDEGGIKLTVDS